MKTARYAMLVLLAAATMLVSIPSAAGKNDCDCLLKWPTSIRPKPPCVESASVQVLLFRDGHCTHPPCSLPAKDCWCQIQFIGTSESTCTWRIFVDEVEQTSLTETGSLYLKNLGFTLDCAESTLIDFGADVTPGTSQIMYSIDLQCKQCAVAPG
jgi:hypothetical protein